MPRFAILKHVDSRGEHFDFMLEVEGVLKTWALPRPPEPGADLDCRPLPDHRIAYLDYEGPVSGDRGSVARWDQGTYTVERRSDVEWIVQLAGERLAARATLRRDTTAANGWRFSLSDRVQGEKSQNT